MNDDRSSEPLHEILDEVVDLLLQATAATLSDDAIRAKLRQHKKRSEMTAPESRAARTLIKLPLPDPEVVGRIEIPKSSTIIAGVTVGSMSMAMSSAGVDDYAGQVRADAQTYAAEVRAKADGYEDKALQGAAKVQEEIRLETERNVKRLLAQAHARAKQILDDAEVLAAHIVGEAERVVTVEPEFDDQRSARDDSHENDIGDFSEPDQGYPSLWAPTRWPLIADSDSVPSPPTPGPFIGDPGHSNTSARSSMHGASSTSTHSDVVSGSIVESELVTRATRGESEATSALLRLFQPGILRYCRTRLGRIGGAYTTADDVSQEVCVALLRALPRYQDQGMPISALVYGIAARKVTDAQRAAIRYASPEPDPAADQLDPDPGPEERAIAIDQNRLLGRLLNQLPETQREIIVLRVAVGLSADEVGDTLRMSSAAVRVAQSRALAKLRMLAGDTFNEPGQ